MFAEIWRDITGFDAEVSDLGNVRSKTREVRYSDGRIGVFKGRDLRASRGANGYRMVTLGRGRRMLVHTAVALAFLGEKPEWAECVNHKNGDKLDNRAANLEWSTYAENNRHARLTGLQRQKGENCNLTRYSDQLVSAIRRVHERYNTPYRELADLFDVSETMASQVVRGQTRN